MTTLVADIIGLIGSVIFIGAFSYANVSPSMDKVLFNILNLVGAVLLLISLSVNFNLAAVVLEAAWGCIAIMGLASALRSRRAGR
jgi:hypothetical protein